MRHLGGSPSSCLHSSTCKKDQKNNALLLISLSTVWNEHAEALSSQRKRCCVHLLWHHESGDCTVFSTKMKFLLSPKTAFSPMRIFFFFLMWICMIEIHRALIVSTLFQFEAGPAESSFDIECGSSGATGRKRILQSQAGLQVCACIGTPGPSCNLHHTFGFFRWVSQSPFQLSLSD